MTHRCLDLCDKINHKLTALISTAVGTVFILKEKFHEKDTSLQ